MVQGPTRSPIFPIFLKMTRGLNQVLGTNHQFTPLLFALVYYKLNPYAINTKSDFICSNIHSCRQGGQGASAGLALSPNYLRPMSEPTEGLQDDVNSVLRCLCQQPRNVHNCNSTLGVRSPQHDYIRRTNRFVQIQCTFSSTEWHGSPNTAICCHS
jgi:hypothetical protein